MKTYRITFQHRQTGEPITIELKATCAHSAREHARNQMNANSLLADLWPCTMWDIVGEST